MLGLAVDRGRAVVVALNKWDLLRGDEARKDAVLQTTTDVLAFAPWARVVRISALTGAGLDRLFPIGAIAGQVGGGHQSSRLLHESLELPGEWPLVAPVGPFRGEGPKGPGEIGLANTGPKPEWDPAPDLHAGGVQAGK